MHFSIDRTVHTTAFDKTVVDHWLERKIFIFTIPPDRIVHTTAFVTPVVEHWLEQEIAQWVHHEESIRRPIAP